MQHHSTVADTADGENGNMRLVYFPVNTAWAFITGEDIRTARPTSMYIGAGQSQLFFSTRSAAVEAARLRGLDVAADGRVTVSPAVAREYRDASLRVQCPATLRIMHDNCIARAYEHGWDYSFVAAMDGKRHTCSRVFAN